VPRPHRSPAQIYHQELEALGRFRGSLEGRNVELLEDGIGSNALDAIVTELTWDIPEQGSPRVWWFYGTGSAKALTTELTKELWFNPAMYTRFKVMIA
jgi:hypothetical protein